MRVHQYVFCLLLAGLLQAQQQPELTGTLSFDVGSESGRVESLAVQIGDGGTGPYKAILAGDPSLPTHAIYRPRDLEPFGEDLLLPIVAFGNGGCRNGSGEFRNFLSDVASHGYLVVAIGPAGDAVVAGSDGRTGMTVASQLLDGVDWATKQNSSAESEYYQKVDTSKVAVMGQSCGTAQAREVSGDPRVTTTVFLNGGGPMGGNRSAAAARGTAPPVPAAVAPASAPQPQTTPPPNRYAPYAPTAAPATPMFRSQTVGPTAFHGPVAFINGGPSDLAYNGAVAGFESVIEVPALLAFQDVGHYPATFREPNGGAFAVAVNAWLDWHLKGDQSASKMFVGSSCGLCMDPKWTIRIKNLPQEETVR